MHYRRTLQVAFVQHVSSYVPWHPGGGTVWPTGRRSGMVWMGHDDQSSWNFEPTLPVSDRYLFSGHVEDSKSAPSGPDWPRKVWYHLLLYSTGTANTCCGCLPRVISCNITERSRQSNSVTWERTGPPRTWHRLSAYQYSVGVGHPCGPLLGTLLDSVDWWHNPCSWNNPYLFPSTIISKPKCDSTAGEAYHDAWTGSWAGQLAYCRVPAWSTCLGSSDRRSAATIVTGSIPQARNQRAATFTGACKPLGDSSNWPFVHRYTLQWHAHAARKEAFTIVQAAAAQEPCDTVLELLLQGVPCPPEPEDRLAEEAITIATVLSERATTILRQLVWTFQHVIRKQEGKPDFTTFRWRVILQGIALPAFTRMPAVAVPQDYDDEIPWDLLSEVD